MRGYKYVFFPMNHDPSRTEALFLAAAEIAGRRRERTAFLEVECGDDQALRRRVEALLASHEEAGEFLDPAPPNLELDVAVLRDSTRRKPASASATTNCSSRSARAASAWYGWPSRSNRWRRRVALKIIKMGMDTKEGDRPLRAGGGRRSR